MKNGHIELLKFALLVCMLLSACLLFAVESTIIDTIWTENSLQGGIGYYVQNGTYSGGIFQPYHYFSDIGDSYDQWYTNNDVCARAYYSFGIQTIPSNYIIDSVIINVYQFTGFGNGDFNVFPIWYDNQYYPCNLYHVVYGLTFEPADFDPVIYDTLGAISTDASRGWKRLNITNAFLEDMAAQRQYTQLMFKFPILTDYDQLDDYLDLGCSYSGEYSLYVTVYYSSNTLNNDDVMPIDDVLCVYPNPCKDNISISMKNRMRLDKVDIYNIKGQKVLSDTSLGIRAGETRLNFDKSIMSAGIYILKAQVTSKNKTYTITKRISVY